VASVVALAKEGKVAKVVHNVQRPISDRFN